ncbi:DUF4230 domain-containing protein [Polluticaenibacter yanchengensis]|uniref:DUF4230 domain-containing protein n=1 Tax=Polluticaenibacter yanchengensis TaxID=3014562 RepID=A0ABT4UKC9_9BACT|nr:DUF4230 domain-containing protein [Chitinophagaceae bacterium LY-5]
MFRYQLLYIVVLFSIFTAACGSKNELPKEPQLIIAVQSLQQLATVEYTISKVIKANDNKTWYTIGDRKILFTSNAKIKAGIDLSKLQAENITVNGKSISIKLPEPEIFSINIPPDEIKEAYSEKGFWRDEFSAEEKQQLLQQAETQIKQAAYDPQLGILNQAKLSTQTYLTNLLTSLGFEQVYLYYGDKNPLFRLD